MVVMKLRIGELLAGYMLDAPINENEWATSNIRAFSLIQVGHHLRQGNLHLPRLSDSHAIPMCAIRDIATFGINHADIKDQTCDRGAFQIQEGTPTSGGDIPYVVEGGGRDATCDAHSSQRKCANTAW